ncbi:metal ion transporter metal ion transporter [Drepanopeziza brunnea f. sp. 'multigermtubi' MB_m1]|uniref:Metal ion transporter metal ion transporter n=1 Tax=Marssonina brunnea f. sp. multigermtubi (strain MB_m1) TaxID=1072389 RepID=K1WQA5_MARBU|nr:metal ion transporter metal ion transporter [Drepanopeziza brunnea f. sp. 'multigermtubi' MB_m1]EKD19820.1 metal ion transporter metal ion transporter [Drepanopeziza brunnea f. sp. 'multigermtubi' MB_m1]
MNCPSRTEEPEGDGMNQSPRSLSADLTTRQDLNGIANARELRRIASMDSEMEVDRVPDGDGSKHRSKRGEVVVVAGEGVRPSSQGGSQSELVAIDAADRGSGGGGGGGSGNWDANVPFLTRTFLKIRKGVKTYVAFVGPGFMISVAYIDPGNYATDVAAGATYRFKLLFIVLMSNIFAIFLQSLCIKLGSVSGLNLAEACRAFLPWWLNIFLYIMAETAIIATDIAEVIGTAIAINLLVPQIPLVAGCAISIIDVLLILLFYRPNGSMKGLRAFEMFVASLVLGVVVCFCIQLSLIKDTSVGDVVRGYLPSSAILESKGLYQACGILGATVMPHSLYLGSGIVQPRLQEYDIKHGIVPASIRSDSDSIDKVVYYPSLPAINFCLKLSIVELAFSLFTFALFVNSAILITAGASLYGTGADDADLFGIHRLLSDTISSGAGTIFALALLMSGISAGIVCTIAGQMVSEGALNWTIAPWMRRLITRSISITPSIIIAAAVGKEGLSAALNGSQVALSIVLPFVTAPLIYFTCRNKYMTVRASTSEDRDDETDDDTEARPEVEGTKMRNNWATATFGVIIWLIITVMNVANLVLLGRGDT